MGSSKSKELLVQLCKNVRELNQLVEVGCLLGIQEWTDVFQEKCQHPHSSIQMLLPEVEELFEADNLEEVNLCFFLASDLQIHVNTKHVKDKEKQMSKGYNFFLIHCLRFIACFP